MPQSDNQPVCPKFQPNIFDRSRCHDCLRQQHLHAEASQQKPTAAAGTGLKGGLLTPVPAQAEEREASSKDDSDAPSVVSSYCDVIGGHLGNGPGSLCILSADCELFIWDDDSTDRSLVSFSPPPSLPTRPICHLSTVAILPCSCRDQSDSVSAEDDDLPTRRRSSTLDMTRLDPPPHRPTPRAWMEESRSRDDLSRRSGLRDDRPRRESGYFSLGRAAGARSLRDSSPPAPFRHFERGHPIFSHRSVEPKDTIPFRNPNLGVASERQVPDNLDEDLPLEILPPDPYEVAVEVEAQVGPRSPSPTPFKIAESLASNTRKRFNSPGAQGTWSSSHQPGRFEASRQSSALQSRSSSPSRGSLAFRRSESTASLSRHGFDDGGKFKGAEPGRSSLQSTRCVESGTLPRNFKAFAGSVKSQSGMVSDFRSALRRTEASGSLSSRGCDRRSSPPSRREYNPPGQMSPRKTESSSSSPVRQRAARTSSPPRVSDNRSSPPRRTFGPSAQSSLRQSESVTSLNGHGHYGRCGSPIREGYDIESQAQLRRSAGRNGQDYEEYEQDRSHEAPGRSILRKTEGSTRGSNSRSPSPGRRGLEAPARYQPKKANSSSLLNVRSHEGRNSSPSRRSREAPSLLRTSELNTNRDSHALLPSRRSYDAPQARSPHRPEPSRTLNSRTPDRHRSPPRTGPRDAPGYSLLRHATNADAVRSSHRRVPFSESEPDSKHSPRSWRESTPARSASPSRQTTKSSRVTLEPQRSPSRYRSGVSRHCPSPGDRTLPQSPPTQMRRHTSSQSSMESSESGQVSVGSTGRNREEYATMADLPKVKRIHQMEEPGHVGPQSQLCSRRQELFKPASHSLSKHPSTERLDALDSDRDWSHGGFLSGAQSTSLQVRICGPCESGSGSGALGLGSRRPCLCSVAAAQRTRTGAGRRGCRYVGHVSVDAPTPTHALTHTRLLVTFVPWERNLDAQARCASNLTYSRRRFIRRSFASYGLLRHVLEFLN
ncbi:serine/arginine repetitive matrix protein 2 [Betta splendens]|uniref:Serine/arginine repetitive matrix protein 2 n=1 Tax=Betta splendens TaxID=158456 RepID=A0A9W2XZ47_BETSP|nr:serine/arginine repetitive matrix protein 2 [Betta splendens]